MNGLPGDPLAWQLQQMLPGNGYTAYHNKNQARADDLLVRQKAAGSLDEAAQRLAGLEGDYQRQFIGAATRENPFPPAESMNKLREISDLRQRLGGLATRIRTMAVPTQDKTWKRLRDETTLLNQLLQFDYQLISQTEAIYQQVAALTAPAWQQGSGSAQFNEGLQRLDALTRDRQRFLQIPG